MDKKVKEQQVNQTLNEQQSSKRETSEGHKRRDKQVTYTSERQSKKEPDKNATNKSDTSKFEGQTSD